MAIAQQVDNSAAPRRLGDTNALQDARTIYREAVLRNWRARKAPISMDSSQEEEATAVELEVPKETGIVRLPTPIVEIPREEKLQEWEGQIQEVGDNWFTARLVDLTNRDSQETEEVELPISDVPDADRDLVVPGAIFRWLIAYKHERGDKTRFTRVTIRRLPMWTDAEIKEADKEATELHQAIFRNSASRAAEAR